MARDGAGVWSDVPSALSRLTAGRRGLLAVGAGVATGLGHVPFSLTPLALVGGVLALWLFQSASGPRAAFWTGWWVGLGYFGLVLNWIVEPFLVDIARHGWMAPFALVLLSGGMALFWGGAFALAHRLTAPGWTRALGWAVCLTLTEMLRATILTGFPWALIGYIWSQTAAFQILAPLGPFGLTALSLLCTAVGVQCAGRRLWVAVGLLGVQYLALVGVGAALMAPTVGDPPNPADRPLIRLVQPNAPQHQKWDPDHAAAFFARQLEYTAASGAPDLIVWPETAIPYLVEPGHPALKRIAEAAQGTPVVLGAQRYNGLRAFNSLFAIGAGGRIDAVYDKHHLVPFGEFIPLGAATRWLGLQSFAARDGYGFSPGPGRRTLNLGGLGRVLPLICYEAIFPWHARAPEGEARPDWLLQVTNDAWFGTFSGPYQHLIQARARAIEQGLPMVRVANTGVSAMIDGRGRVLDRLPLGVAGFVDAPLPPALAQPLYARTGDGPLALVLVLALLALRRRVRWVKD